MLVIIELPAVVTEALAEFDDLLANAPGHRHFAEYLTGLFAVERKNVSVISPQFVQSTDQPCPKCWLTEMNCDIAVLNRRRLDWLQRDPVTRYSERGAIALDNVLIDRDDKMIEDVDWFWIHVEQRRKAALGHLIANYVSGIPEINFDNDAINQYCRSLPFDLADCMQSGQCHYVEVRGNADDLCHGLPHTRGVTCISPTVSPERFVIILRRSRSGAVY